jgi:hypothetical protein
MCGVILKTVTFKAKMISASGRCRITVIAGRDCMQSYVLSFRVALPPSSVQKVAEHNKQSRGDI